MFFRRNHTKKNQKELQELKEPQEPKKLRLHFLQHVEFEALGVIENWAQEKGMQITSTKLYEGEVLPDKKELSDIDLVLIMGGSMNIYEYDKYPWLKEEKEFITRAIRQASLSRRMSVVGICLGAQLIADVLGAKVASNQFKEIGWFPIRSQSDLLPDSLEVFHWHGDTFSIPRGAKCIAFSQGCGNQGFIYKERILGLQFHLEMTNDGINEIYQNCADDIESGPYVQQHNISDTSRIDDANQVLINILDGLMK